MAGDEQTDASGKYGMNGRGPQGAAKYWPTIFKAIELVSYLNLKLCSFRRCSIDSNISMENCSVFLKKIEFESEFHRHIHER